MLTFIKKDHNFDGEDTQIKREKEKQAENAAPEKMKFMSLSDLLTLLVIAGLIGGGYYYFKTSKENSAAAFAKCDEIFNANQLLAAEACYDSTWDLGYIADSMEIVRQNRTSLIADLRLTQMDLLQSVQDYIKENDLNAAKEEMKKLQGENLLIGKHLEAWKKAEAAVAAVPATVEAPAAPAVQDSSVKQ